MKPFDRFVVVDWSARSAPSPATPSADAIWIANHADGETKTSYWRTRSEAAGHLAELLESALANNERTLAGFDFPFGYPRGFAQTITGEEAALPVWAWLARQIEDTATNSNNRFVVAAEMNARFPGIGPFWGRPKTLDVAGLPDKGSARDNHGLPEKRGVEALVPRAQACWKLYTTGSVGSQMLLGLPYLHALRETFGKSLSVWPFEAPDAPIVLAEIYPSLLSASVDAVLRADTTAIKDEVQVRLLARALGRLPKSDLTRAFAAATEAAEHEEGWILGVGIEEALNRTALPETAAPQLKNDCFALPPGVDWVPVEDALVRLREGLSPVVTTEGVAVTDAEGRYLAATQTARRAHPPKANSAVDGYGFAHASIGDGHIVLPLAAQAAAAGRAVKAVPHGHAIRILTGAALPKGVDTVVLEEDTRIAEGHVVFGGPVKPGANTRAAGEDLVEGATAITKGARLRPPDLAMLTSVGIGEVEVFTKLRVGVLSTGDELIEPTSAPGDHGIYDANRPMLLSLVRRWGHFGTDLGISADRREVVRTVLDAASKANDAILTSGGASAGDEDHVSALLRTEGTVATWRIAMKPGRPLLLGFWNDVPVFGLPGNPVAAFVCALIFARPALSVLAGGPWTEPQGYTLRAAFSKRKKAGRREYLRARVGQDGSVEAFKSEGSGRISGISWADGLVELEDGTRDITPGDPVRYIPFASFGL